MSDAEDGRQVVGKRGPAPQLPRRCSSLLPLLAFAAWNGHDVPGSKGCRGFTTSTVTVPQPQAGPGLSPPPRLTPVPQNPLESLGASGS